LRNRVIVLVGPTAVGKTSVSIELARLVNGEIVSADSVAVYKRLDIGSAKPTIQEQNAVKFHIINVLDPQDSFSAGDFQKLAQAAIIDIIARGKTAIVVGGSGLYVRAAIDGLNLSLPDKDVDLRRRLYGIAERRGQEYVHRILSKLDKLSAEKIPAGNLKRVIRTIEITLSGDKPASELYAEDAARPSTFPDAVFFGLRLPRAQLYERIDYRVDSMIRQGFVHEVRGLIESGIPKHALSMQSLGYKEIIAFLNGTFSLSEAIEEIKKNTRRFAKRQNTWFKADERIKWVDMQCLSARQVAVMIKESLTE